MRILFITDNFPPEVNAPATRTYDHCRLWVKAGAEVTVLTCAPNFPDGIVYDGYRNALFQRSSMDGIDVIRVWSFIARNEGFVRRIIDYVSFAVAAFVCGLFRKFDVIVATSPQFFVSFAGWGVAALRSKPWVLEVRDLWPESILAVGAMRESWITRALERVELFMYRRATLIVPVTRAFRDNMVKRGVDPGKIVVVENGANLEKFRCTSKDDALLRAHGLVDQFVFSYIGTHGMAHGLEFIVRSIAQIRRTDVSFMFIGSGSNKRAIVELATRLQLRNAIFIDPVPKDEVPRYLSIADVALVPLRKVETFKTVIPSKIFEAAAMRRPILLGVDGQAREIVERCEAGLFFEPENTTSFLTRVEELVSDRALYERLQLGCGRLAATYDRAALAKRMIDSIANLTR
jgi:glycosyltransferase involved in cell wall biosynthesis